MTWMTSTDFEQRYRADPDPWGYTRRPYERLKYEDTLSACGPGPFDSALELGGSIGVFSEMLAPRCARLVTVDLAPTAVAKAQARLAEHRDVEVILGEIPAALPDESYDLVVASEILYYLAPAQLDDTLAALATRMRPGGRLVAVHWRPTGSERPFDAETVHAILRTQPWLIPERAGGTADYLLDVMTRR
jgi:SAM-dependent methyltransferase